MDRSKFVAVLTGAIAILISIAYLLIVQLLDLRGEMIPAPVDLSYVFLQDALPSLSFSEPPVPAPFFT